MPRELPNQIWITTSEGIFSMPKSGDNYAGGGALLSISAALEVTLLESKNPVYRVELLWRPGIQEGALVLGDAWERGYGTFGWGPYDYDRDLPWYGASYQAGELECFGVLTGCNCFAHWRAGVEGLHVVLDLRSGNRPLILKGRTLRAALIKFASVKCSEAEVFSHLRTFLGELCPHPRLAQHPVYGANDWYYAYGNNSAEGILEDSKRVSDLANNLENRPFSVIDDGWQLTDKAVGGPWRGGNSKFPDMPGLAHKIAELGCQPGIWTRPLHSEEPLPESWKMAPNTMDPSVPEVLDRVRDDIHRLHHWGYQLIKHDYSSFEMTAQWGCEMSQGFAGKNRTFTDQSRTTAEIVLDFYKAIRDAAGSSLIIGCNTVSHLSAGLFEIMRIGDDTSGREWPRTVKMGVNSLAFRGPQHDRFYAADADCVGITTDVPWEKTKQWLELVSRSGTPLFVSAQSKAVGSEQQKALEQAFSIASRPMDLAEPLDWMNSRAPSKWKFGSETQEFDWKV